MISIFLIEYLLEKKKEKNKECSDVSDTGKSTQCPFMSN